MKRITVVMIGIVFLSVFISTQAVAKGRRVSPEIYYLHGTTDKWGNFSIKHGLGSEAKIVGVIVSMFNKGNQNWYTIHAGKGISNRIAWQQDTTVSGIIEHPTGDYKYQAVRVLIFVIPSPQ